MEKQEIIKKLAEATGALEELKWSVGQTKERVTGETVEDVRAVLENVEIAAAELVDGLRDLARQVSEGG